MFFRFFTRIARQLIRWNRVRLSEQRRLDRQVERNQMWREAM